MDKSVEVGDTDAATETVAGKLDSLDKAVAEKEEPENREPVSRLRGIFSGLRILLAVPYEAAC